MAPASLEVVPVALAGLPEALGGGALQALCLLAVPGPEGPALLGDPAPLAGAGVGLPRIPARLEGPWCTARGFRAAPGQLLSLRTMGQPDLFVAGVVAPPDTPSGVPPGPAGPDEVDSWRRAGAALVRAAADQDGVLVVAVSPFAGDPARLAGCLAAFGQGASLAGYGVTKRTGTPKAPRSLRLVLAILPAPLGEPVGHIPPVGSLVGQVAQDLERALTVARAVNDARDLVNAPPSDLNPRVFAERISATLGSRPGVSLEVWDEHRIASERLGGLLGVSRGSTEPPRLVRATYRPTSTPQAPSGSAGPPEPAVAHLVLVGKGITFDSGGLSLKSADGMTTMKTDMSGAAIVMAALGAGAELGLPVALTAIAPLAENMPGSTALKPGDVLEIRDGQTIEVLNTDAEGRLVLADALALAAEIVPPPDLIVDVATLTGAARVALGNEVAPLFGNIPEAVERVRAAGERVGEALWPMPLPASYAEHIDSDIADMKNIGRPGQAGSIAAALLLARFVAQIPWAHMDIAGTGRAAEAAGYVAKGGTAFGVRTLVELAASFVPLAGGPPGTARTAS